ncbi:MAG: hypothetical protein KDA91_02940 [Planctomycetaceae bacterium]|nr:hypothetical protein [Planctomycetaceae bacterium]
MWTLLFALAMLGASGKCMAQNKAAPASRWEKDISEMESRIASGMSAKGDIVFVGSSSIRLWKLKDSFPELNACNHGFGGSEISDSIEFFDRIVAPVQPKAIVLYAGDNDIAKGKTADRVVADFLKFAEKSDASTGKPTPIFFICIKPSLKRWSMADTIQEANHRIQEICSKSEHLHYVDVWAAMLDADGMPKKDLFVKDGLHMSPAGYAIWTRQLATAFTAAGIATDK